MKKDLAENKNIMYYTVFKNFIKNNPNNKLCAERMLYDRKRTDIMHTLGLDCYGIELYNHNDDVRVFSPHIYIYDTRYEKEQPFYTPEKLPGDPGDWTDNDFSIIVHVTIKNGKLEFFIFNYGTHRLEFYLVPKYDITTSSDNENIKITLSTETSIAIEGYDIWVYDIILNKIREFEQSKMVNK
jgi:hypothetical protein